MTIQRTKTSPEARICLNLSLRKPDSQSLNSKLMAILLKTPVSWQNQGNLKEIQKAVKSSNNYYKKLIIEKYEFS